MLVEPAFAGEVAALQAPLPPDKRDAIADAFRRSIAFDAACLAVARQGALVSPASAEARACVDVSGNPDTLDDTLRRVEAHLQTLPRVWEAQESEFASFTPEGDEPDVNTRELDEVHPSFGDKPLVVLSRGVEEGAPGRPAGLSAEGRGRLASRPRPDRGAFDPGRQYNRSSLSPLYSDRPAGSGGRGGAARRRGDSVAVATRGLGRVRRGLRKSC